MIFKYYKIFYILCFSALFFLLYLFNSIFFRNYEMKINKADKCYEYKNECIRLFHKIRYPKNGTIFRPPLKEIPKELYEEFTQNGFMPLRKKWYINEAYADASSVFDIDTKKTIVRKSEIDMWRDKVKKKVALNYGNTELQNIMFKYSNKLQGQNVAIIGTQLPWIEAISLEIGMGKITTLDYTRKKYEQSDMLEWVHVNDFLDNSIENSEIEQFDNAVTFSSIEHAGLGRYGDPLNPNGDFDAVRQVHCMLKPGGLFFLGLPTTQQEKGFIDFNAHRYYGFKRLELLFEGWVKLDETLVQNNDIVYLLMKKECSNLE